MNALKAWMIPTLMILTGIVPAGAQTSPASRAENAEYQMIKIRFRILDLDGRSLENATLFVRLDTSSTRPAPDKIIKATVGTEEFSYDANDPSYRLRAGEQTSNAQGFSQVPFIVYSNRTDPIDYELDLAYGAASGNHLLENQRKLPVYPQDSGKLITLNAKLRRSIKWFQYLMAGTVVLGGAFMGAILFFRILYPLFLPREWGIDRTRALCWSGAVLVFLTTLALVYWHLLPLVIPPVLFFVFLGVIWLITLLAAIAPRKAPSSY